MKKSDSKNSPTQTSKGSPFFSKEGGQDFFGSLQSDNSFFSKNSLAGNSVQTKLSIGKANDKYEQEADAVADKVVQRLAMPDVLTKKETSVQTRSLASAITPLVQTKCTTCEQEEKLQKKEEEDIVQESPLELQLKPIFESNAVPPDDENNIQRKCTECENEEKLQKKPNSSDSKTSSSHIESNLNSSKGGGLTIPATTMGQMESSFGVDFSHVRLHTGSKAVQMNKDLHAQAFTHGNDIYFNSSKYDTSSKSGQHLLAHELTHTLQQKGTQIKVIQNKDEPTLCSNTGKSRPKSIPSAAVLLTEKYPHLTKVMSGSQLDQIQKTIDAQYKVSEFIERQKPYSDRIYHDNSGGYGGSSSDVEKWKYYNEKISEQISIKNRNRLLFVDSKLLAADDIKRPDIEENPAILAYHEQLYKRFTEKPVRIIVDPCLATNDLFNNFLQYSWEAYDRVYWDVSHEKGLVRFRNLMAAQKLNVDYQSLVVGEQVKILGRMVELRREMGNTMIADGKRIGEIWRFIMPSRDVKVKYEIGDIGGYYNDPRGRLSMINDLFKSELATTSRVVLVSKDNWLHIFSTEPNFDSTEMTSPENDGFLYILTRTKSPDLEIYEHFITKDARFLQPGKTTFKGSGWRMPQEMTEFEEFAIGAIFGDAFEANSGDATFGQIVIGMIPIVGQIADARDVLIGIHKIWESGGKDGKLQTAFALIGFVPLFGDYIKKALKVSRKATPAIKAAAKTEAVVKASKELGEGVSHTSAKKIERAVERDGKKGAEKTLESLPDVKKSFAQDVISEAAKVTDDVATGFKNVDNISGEVSSAFGRKLPDLANPKLVTQAAFKIGDQLHYVKVVEIGNWKQLWICSSNCGSLVGKIDEAIGEASGPVADRLRRLRDSAADLEKKINNGKIKPSDVDKKVGKIGYELNELARKNPQLGGLAKILREDLEREFKMVYKVSSIDELTPGAKAALTKNYRPAPPGYHWRLSDDGTLQVVRNPGAEVSLPKLNYNEATHRFDVDDLVRSASKKFEKQLSPAEVFEELGGNNPASPFGKFVSVLVKELGVPAKKLIDDLGLQNPKGFKDALQDTVRHRLKEPYVEMLFTKISDPQELVKAATYKRVLASTKDTQRALKAASHERLLNVSRNLDSADKGSLGERWFEEWFASRGEHIKTQAKLGPEHGIKFRDVRKIDIYEDHLAREVKNVTSNLGKEGAEQVEDLLAGVGKDVKIGGTITGYDSVRLVFIDPIGGAANARWMVEQLKKFKDSPLSFQIMNKDAIPLVISSADVAKHGEAGLEKIILDWVKVQPKLIAGGSNDKYEQQADSMADKVMQRIGYHESVQVQPVPTNSITPFIQAKGSASDEEEKAHYRIQMRPTFESDDISLGEQNMLQKKCSACETNEEEKVSSKSENGVTAVATPSIESNLSPSNGSGNSLPEQILPQMESFIGTDFSRVRLHIDSAAAQMNTNLNAQAFTHGNDIYFNSGKYDTKSTSGKHLLAHELTHVVQQGGTINKSVAQRVADDARVYRKNILSGDTSAFFSGRSIIQRETDDPNDAGDQDISGVKSPTTVPLPTFDFNDKRQEFGRFDASYTPVGPVPAEGTLEIDLWVHIIFEDFSAKRKKKDPYKNVKFTKDQLKDFTWNQEEKEKFELEFMTSVQNAWSSKFKFRLKDPAFAEYLSKVQVNVLTTDDPILAHTKVTALKVPKNAPRFRSFVKGNEATLDIRDPSEPEKRKVGAHDLVRQIGPFGFDSSDITPELVEQIKEVAGFLRSNTDPDHWSLGFAGRATSEGSTAYNEKLGQKRSEAVRKELFRQVGWGEEANYFSILSGEHNATTEEKFRRVDITVNKASDAGAQKDVEQNVAAHEAGHMFGLGDEYVEEKPTDKDTLPKFLGDKPSHYEAVKKLMGKEAADELLVQSSESIMGSGMNVKKGHYVTFLHAINQITGKSWNAE